MKHIGWTAIIWTLAGIWTDSIAFAQSALPDFRYVATRDVDFYGADLDALFDTDLDSCVRTCAANRACVGFTFNTRSNACFPKSNVSDKTPYVGAVSAEKYSMDPALVAQAERRRAELGFLKSEDIDRARTQARDLGLRYQAGGRELSAILDAARARREAGDTLQAMGWTGAAVSLSDRADLWAEYSRLLLSIQTDNRSRRQEYERRAASAAINAYIRGKNAGARASALVILADAFERSGRGRDTIPALRLALSHQPRDDIADALERNIGKFGFRITDSQVESDSVAPRVCAEFSEPLVKAGVEYENFVRLPDPGMVVQADGKQLCVDGVAHGQRYRLTFRRGLPAASGETLHKDVELTHYVRDRGPKVRFPGRAYVMPKTAEAALPVETVNIDRIELRLRKISDRNLLRTIQDGFFGRPLSQWQDRTFASEMAEEVWTGTADVGNELNRDVTTRLPLGQAIADQPAGIYALTARIPGADPYDEPGATQWFVLSDLGISSMLGTDGLHVQVNGLVDAAPRAGVEVTLISRANAVLAAAKTSPDGYVRFEPGLTRGVAGAAPALILARNGARDLGFLSLIDPAFDLSDRGVEGRAPSGPIDVFITTDRGAYRAGETIHLTALSRDSKAQAIVNLPLTAILSRPDGVEYRRLVSDGGQSGGHVFAFPIGPGAPRGTWQLAVKSDPNADALANQAVLVEDFLPERIDFDLSLPDAPVRAGDTLPLSIDARYLFGAPGADLSIDGDVTLTAAESLTAWPGYRFGRYDSAATARKSFFGGQRTDAKGQATVAIELPAAESEGQPLQAVVIARLADGSGRPVERRLTAPVLPETPVIGIRPLFSDVVGEGSEAGFEIIGLAPDLTPRRMRVQWTLNRVETRYQWYQLYGDWNWEPTTRRVRVSTGVADLESAPVAVSAPVEWGRYELVVERLDGDYAAAAVDFYAGWYAPADSSATPDRLEVSLDQPRYSPGDTARLRIVPRAAGTAMISVMSDRLIERKVIEVPAGESLIPLTVTDDWGTGAYVTTTVIRAMDVDAGQNPKRSLGLAHAAVEPVGKKLAVQIDIPDAAEPRRIQKVRVKVDGASQDQKQWLTLAAVDVGILNLTGFESPDPEGHFFGQRRLGVEMRDVYGRLIDGMNGALGTVRSGGDAGARMRLQSPPPTQDLMAVFSGPIQLSPEGEAIVDVPLPAFNGTVRFMAVAWSDTAIGQAETDMLVRDPVVITANVPRFLAPGDSSRIRLEAVHADGPAGDMQIALRTTANGLELSGGPGLFTLDQGGKAVFDIPVKALEVGDHRLQVVLATPDQREHVQDLVLSVRANDPVVAQTRRFSLAAGDSFQFSDDVFADLRPGTGRAILSAGPLARFDAPGLLAMLDRYPYGCTEQVTSQALPLLYLSAVAQATGLGNGPAVQARVVAAITQILARQAPNGAFGLWRAESGDFWLDAYTSDFLSRARAQGYVIPDQAFRLAMDNLRNRINYAPDFDSGGGDIAYALMVLAREGAAAMGDLRYYADVKGDAFDTPLAAAQVGSALAAYGDQTRADAMFARAARMISDVGDDPPVWRADYGTRLRDAAGVLTLAVEAGSQVVDASRISNQIARADGRLSTQEAAWTLLAANALAKSPEQSGLEVNGAPASGPFIQVLDGSGPSGGVTISATGGRASDITLTTLGVPEIAPEAGGTGYAIERSNYDMDGNQIDGNTVRVGDRFVTVLRVTAFESSQARLMIDDPLPAGIEIDNPNLLRSGDVRALDWLKLSEAAHSEFRSDRFLSAVDLQKRGPVTLAYVARAVTPGSYHHPAASVEDMYRPRYRARTATGRMVVTE